MEWHVRYVCTLIIGEMTTTATPTLGTTYQSHGTVYVRVGLGLSLGMYLSEKSDAFKHVLNLIPKNSNKKIN